MLIKRYKETRRSHPLAGNGRLDRGISREREKVAFLKRQADYILDTSSLLTRELREEVARIFSGGQPYENLFVTILSFGFKYGIPADADLVFDVRFPAEPLLRGRAEVPDRRGRGGAGVRDAGGEPAGNFWKSCLI